MPDEPRDVVETNGDELVLQCGNCGSWNIETTIVEDRFIYGGDADAVTFRATVPVRCCRACGEKFTDWMAEDKYHEAVCRHSGVLTPAEVVAIRKHYDMSRHQFARVTRLAEATFERWECGAQIQPPAFDLYLRLLALDENMQRIRAFGGGDKAASSPAQKRRLRRS